MLRISEIFDARDLGTGETWTEFAQKRGYTAAERIALLSDIAFCERLRERMADQPAPPFK